MRVLDEYGAPLTIRNGDSFEITQEVVLVDGEIVYSSADGLTEDGQPYLAARVTRGS